MATNYNILAGHQLERISALSDGIFAVAMTLLVLDIRVPDGAGIRTEAELAGALMRLGAPAATWLLSMMTLGIFWLGQQAQLDQLKDADRNLSWLHFLFLAIVTAVPFTTRLLAGYFDFRLAFIIYWLNILFCGVALHLTWRYAERARLTSEDAPGPISEAIRRRIVRAQALYFVGLLAGLVNPLLGIAIILFVEASYALGLKWTDWT